MAIRLSQERLRLAGDDSRREDRGRALPAVAQVTARQQDARRRHGGGGRRRG